MEAYDKGWNAFRNHEENPYPESILWNQGIDDAYWYWQQIQRVGEKGKMPHSLPEVKTTNSEKAAYKKGYPDCTPDSSYTHRELVCYRDGNNSANCAEKAYAEYETGVYDDD